CGTAPANYWGGYYSYYFDYW
nr:immunoglobulin heavy chain junction region [Macaca mulatta]MOY23834.1 immunoglobulin heavy chain junction region [Macaca mulatta]MOY24665.1 immunoglobulin heavy chain junction region [Macaca mulatta]MOY30633.1 immunoglobulin heavy chain junction region [Macaca mulatta]